MRSNRQVSKSTLGITWLLGLGLALAFGGSQGTWAGRNVWTSNGPFVADEITAIAMDSQNQDMAYAVRKDGNLFRTRDGGGSWVEARSGPLEGVSVDIIAVNPVVAGSVYAINNWYHSLFRSTDGGATWALISNTLPGYISMIATAPGSSSVLYGYLHLPPFPDGEWRIFKSGDGGATWEVTASLGGVQVRALAVDPSDPSIVYAGYGEWTATGFPGGVVKTVDGGASWVPMNNGLSGAGVRSFAISPQATETIFATGWGCGIVKSTDGGASWVGANNGVPAGVHISNIQIDPCSPETLYAVMNSYDIDSRSGILKSTDGGGSWSPVSDYPSGFQYSINALAVGSQTRGTLYSAGRGGLFKTTDGGASWAPAHPSLSLATIRCIAADPGTPKTLYAGTDGGGLFKSTDAGASWAPSNHGITISDVRSVSINPQIPSALYVGTSGGGAFKSTDEGASWAPVSNGLPRTFGPYCFVYQLIFDPRIPDILYANANSFVFKTMDGGAWWQPASDGLPDAPVRSIAIDPRTPETLYCGTGAWDCHQGEGGGVYKTNDGAVTWEHIGSGLPDCFSTEFLTLDPLAPSTLYAGIYDMDAGSGVFRSTDGGGSWALFGDLFPESLFPHAFAFSPSAPATFYLSAEHDDGTGNRYVPGLFRSLDGGITWPAMNSGLPPDSVITCLLTDSATPQTLIAGAWPGGVRSITIGRMLPGDCDGDETVSIGEAQRAINMFLGLEPAGCGADCDGDWKISIGEVQKTIIAFLGIIVGCS